MLNISRLPRLVVVFQFRRNDILEKRNLESCSQFLQLKFNWFDEDYTTCSRIEKFRCSKAETLLYEVSIKFQCRSSFEESPRDSMQLYFQATQESKDVRERLSPKLN